MTPTRIRWMFCVALVLMLVHCHADYLLQAYQHGWNTWLDLSARAPKAVWWLDWFPRDAWHITQAVRNASVLLAAIVMTSVVAWYYLLDHSSVTKRTWILIATSALYVFAQYAIAGGLARSLVYHLLN